jgi:tellurite resistance protein TerC
VIGATAWAVSGAVIVALMGFDFWAQMRDPHEPTFRQSIRWTAFYIAMALCFGASLVWWHSTQASKEFLAGYVTEWSLSVDNLFVFLIIFLKFKVPKAYRQRVLWFGVAIALVLRGLFIAGAAALTHFSWVFYLFGIVLLVTAVNVVREAPEGDEEYHENFMMRGFRRLFSSTRSYHDGALIVRREGRKLATPLLLVMFAIGTTDVIFALDSIPAIFGLTKDPFIVFTANAFALMGLRQLFFLIQGLLDRLIYLSYGLAVILGFIGVKLILQTLRENELGFINGGHPLESLPNIGIEISLAVIVVTLIVTGLSSILATRRQDRRASGGGGAT